MSAFIARRGLRRSMGAAADEQFLSREGEGMAVITGHRTGAALRSRKDGTWEYRLIFGAMFIVFLVAALFERALPRSWRRSKSVFREAREAASTYAPYAFMG